MKMDKYFKKKAKCNILFKYSYWESAIRYSSMEVFVDPDMS